MTLLFMAGVVITGTAVFGPGYEPPELARTPIERAMNICVEHLIQDDCTSGWCPIWTKEWDSDCKKIEVLEWKNESIQDAKDRAFVRGVADGNAK